ncbi:hypothetical protein VNO80_20750 [Phaseolus coccineus]|uniref:Uncharacterized protein n=1 Tax=Phaseolus coccineus TaxID=3886 RepID=A0AAN9QQA7_PHACN
MNWKHKEEAVNSLDLFLPPSSPLTIFLLPPYHRATTFPLPSSSSYSIINSLYSFHSFHYPKYSFHLTFPASLIQALLW